jgi:hypothetical protein
MEPGGRSRVFMTTPRCAAGFPKLAGFFYDEFVEARGFAAQRF